MLGDHAHCWIHYQGYHRINKHRHQQGTKLWLHLLYASNSGDGSCFLAFYKDHEETCQRRGRKYAEEEQWAF